MARIFIILGGDSGRGREGGGVTKNINKNSIEIYLILFYYFYYLECRISLVSNYEVGLKTDEELRKN